MSPAKRDQMLDLIQYLDIEVRIRVSVGTPEAIAEAKRMRAWIDAVHEMSQLLARLAP